MCECQATQTFMCTGFRTCNLAHAATRNKSPLALRAPLLSLLSALVLYRLIVPVCLNSVSEFRCMHVARGPHYTMRDSCGVGCATKPCLHRHHALPPAVKLHACITCDTVGFTYLPRTTEPTPSMKAMKPAAPPTCDLGGILPSCTSDPTITPPPPTHAPIMALIMKLERPISLGRQSPR